MDNKETPTVTAAVAGGDSSADHRWSGLTQVCLINIFARLSLEDRFRSLIFVCKYWLDTCKDPSLNAILDLEPHFASFAAGEESSRWWSDEFERRINSMVRAVVEWSSGDVREIRVRHCSDRAIEAVAERCPNLQVLSIKSSMNVTDNVMRKVALGCPMLVELDISYCYEISCESIALIGRSCPNLKILKRNFMNWFVPSQHAGIVPNEYLSACPQDQDSEAAAIADTMPHLEHLELRFSKLSSRGLGLITGSCLRLEYLDLSGCANLSGCL